MIERAIPVVIGLPLIATGFGLTAAFGIFSFCLLYTSDAADE